jgi:hypothetical protein
LQDCESLVKRSGEEKRRRGEEKRRRGEEEKKLQDEVTNEISERVPIVT